MATQNDRPDPNTSVPHDEATETEVGGRAVEPNTSVPHDQPEPNTSVPHDVD